MDRSVEEADTSDDAMVNISLFMHPADKVVVTTAAYGLQPTAVVTFIPQSDDRVDIKVDVYGFGIETEDFDGFKAFMELLSLSLNEQGDALFRAARAKQDEET